MWAAAVINCHFQNGETTCPQLSRRLPDQSSIFAAETTAISLALNYYQNMGPVHHDVFRMANMSWRTCVVVKQIQFNQPSWCSGLLWLNVLFASNWAWRHGEPFHLPYHEPALFIEWQRHTCSFLLDTKPLWHWGKWKRWLNHRNFSLAFTWGQFHSKCSLYDIYPSYGFEG